jgi:hypothetical protein
MHLRQLLGFADRRGRNRDHRAISDVQQPDDGISTGHGRSVSSAIAHDGCPVGLSVDHRRIAGTSAWTALGDQEKLR